MLIQLIRDTTLRSDENGAAISQLTTSLKSSRKKLFLLDKSEANLFQNPVLDALKKVEGKIICLRSFYSLITNTSIGIVRKKQFYRQGLNTFIVLALKVLP
jgi:hypothetical protein